MGIYNFKIRMSEDLNYYQILGITLFASKI